MSQFNKQIRVTKIEGGTAFGFAIVCTEAGADYIDVQGDHIPEAAMAEAAEEFMKSARVGSDQHTGEQVGHIVFGTPVFAGQALAHVGTDGVPRTGLFIGFKPHDPELLKMLENGERTGFSIGGTLDESEDRDVSKAAGGPRRARCFKRFKIEEISLVTKPAMEGARVDIVKSDDAIEKATPITSSVRMLPTTIDSGHQHVLNPDGRSGRTSSDEMVGAGSHSHAWTRDDDGSIVISVAAGHSHRVLEFAASLPPQAGVAKTWEQRRASVTKAVQTYQALHGLASYEEAFARATAEDPATRAAYDDLAAIRRGAVPATISKSDPIAKAREAVAKHEGSLRSAVMAYARIAKITNYEAALAMGSATDPTIKKAWDDLAEARHQLRTAPLTVATAPLDAEIAKLRSEIETAQEEFGVAHDLDPGDAVARLRVVSKSFAAKQDRVLELLAVRDRKREAARMRSEMSS